MLGFISRELEYKQMEVILLLHRTLIKLDLVLYIQLLGLECNNPERSQHRFVRILPGFWAQRNLI